MSLWFQSLIGRMATPLDKSLHRPPDGFQSLIGRMATFSLLSLAFCRHKFQSLIGRMATDWEGRIAVGQKGFNPS